MPAAYPLGLPLALARKSRSQPAAFAMREPRRGYGYAQATGTDVPVFWDCDWVFQKYDAMRFQLWFRDVIGLGVDEFTMPLATEFGLVEHVCRFLPSGLLPAQQDGTLWRYSATIMARALVVPPEFDDAGEMIAGLPDWQHWLALLDQAMTAEMPEA